MDNNDMLQTLMGILSNPAAKDKLNEVISGLGGAPQGNTQEDENFNPEPQGLSAVSSNNNEDAIVKIKSMLDNFNNTKDSRISLLNSIKPYMRTKRSQNIDMAIRFIQILNFTSGFRGG